MSSIFTKIINGEIPSYKIAENNTCFAFLDINPNTKGHTLCVPKKEVDNLFDLDDEMYTQLMLFSKKVAKAIKKAISCKRVGVTVVGLEVPHAHIHLIPLQTMNDMNFSKEKVQLTETEFKEIAASIQAAF